MKYFVTAAQRKASGSSCYHEFSKGNWDENAPVFWKEDSIYMEDDLWTELEGYKLLSSTIPTYDPYGPTRVSQNQWEQIVKAAKTRGGELYAAIAEADAWARENFKDHPVFTILGI